MSEDTTQRLPDDGVRLILARLDSMNLRFDSMDARLDSMDARLTALEDKVERRLHDTRPIWEQVLVRLTNIEERLTGVERELVGIKERLTKVEEEVYGLNRKVRIFSVDITKLQDKDDDLEERLKHVEAERTR